MLFLDIPEGKSAKKMLKKIEEYKGKRACRQKYKEPKEILLYLQAVGRVDSKIKLKVADLVRTEKISNPKILK